MLVSEDLAWPSRGGKFFNDLLPLPYTKDTLDNVCEHITQVQEAIQRPILLENPSTYVAFASSTMSETDFIRAVAQRTGCGLLLTEPGHSDIEAQGLPVILRIPRNPTHCPPKTGDRTCKSVRCRTRV